jgi:hypothetical protein
MFAIKGYNMFLQIIGWILSLIFGLMISEFVSVFSTALSTLVWCACVLNVTISIAEAGHKAGVKENI